MALLDIANTDRTITITKITPFNPGNPTYVQNESTKVRENNKKVIVGDIKWTMAGCNYPNYAVSVPGSGTMSPIANKVTEKILNMKPIRLNDSGLCSGKFVQLFFPFGIIPCQCRFDVTNAGQNKTKGQ